MHRVFSPLRHLAINIALFALAGPAIGALVPAVLFFLVDASKFGWSWESLGSSWLLAIWFAYPFGIIPAAVTGFACCVFARSRPGWKASLCLGLVGLATSSLFGAYLLDQPLTSGTVFVMCGLSGFIAAVACARLYRPMPG